jgi:hypothetical protein
MLCKLIKSKGCRGVSDDRRTQGKCGEGLVCRADVRVDWNEAKNGGLKDGEKEGKIIKKSSSADVGTRKQGTRTLKVHYVFSFYTLFCMPITM